MTVEGPSDRVYFNRWIELWSDGKLRDGEHYQCLNYGGSLGSYLTADPDNSTLSPDRVNALIAILKINRNLIFLADSDRREEGDELKDHVGRIQNELSDQNMMCWVTAGREVENYLPPAAVEAAYDVDEFDEPEPFDDMVEAIKQARGRETLRKTEEARQIVSQLTKEMLENYLDLAEKLTEVCERIRRWNGLVERRI